MNKPKISSLLRAGVLLGAGVGAGLVTGAAAVAVAQPDRALIAINRLSQVAAAQDGTAWALTSDGKLLHCRFDANQVHCYDRTGKTSLEY